MKLCTDISQSKALAEILPIESADMHYVMVDTENEIYSAGLSNYIGILPSLPCWSLAALLDYLKRHNVALEYDGRTWNIFCKVCSLYAFDDQVDACFGMILRLNGDGLL